MLRLLLHIAFFSPQITGTQYAAGVGKKIIPYVSVRPRNVQSRTRASVYKKQQIKEIVRAPPRDLKLHTPKQIVWYIEVHRDMYMVLLS